MEYGADVLHRALGNPELDVETVDEVRDALIGVGAVDAIEDRIAELTTSALAALEASPVVAPAGERLAELAVSATKRTY
jgi:geranylgeranyl diphosphate synthase type I